MPKTSWLRARPAGSPELSFGARSRRRGGCLGLRGQPRPSTRAAEAGHIGLVFDTAAGMSSEDVAALASRSRARTKICATALAEPKSASACGACTDAVGAAGSPGSDFWPCSAASSSSTLHAVTETTAKRGKSPATNSVPVTAVRLVCTNPSGRSSKNRPFGSVTSLAPAGSSAVRRASAGASVSTARRGRVGWVKAAATARKFSGILVSARRVLGAGGEKAVT